MADAWYLLRAQQRYGPYTTAQLKQMASAAQLLPDDLLWQEGMASWVAPARVDGLFPAPAPAAPPPVQAAPPAVALPAPPPAPAAEWYYLLNGQRLGPVAFEQLRQLAAAGTVKPTDLVWKNGLASWTAAASVEGLAAAPAAAAPAAPPAPAAQLRGFLGNLASKVKDTMAGVGAGLAAPASQLAAAKKPESPAQAIPAAAPPPVALPEVAVEDRGKVFTDAGEWAAGEFARCREESKRWGASLLFFGNTCTRQKASLTKFVANLFGPKKPADPIVHLALTATHLALLHAPEGGQAAVEQAPVAELTWSFEPVASGQGGVLAFFGGKKNEDAPPPSTDRLKVAMPSGEREIVLKHGPGLDRVKQELSRLAYEQALEHFKEDRYYLAERRLKLVRDGGPEAKDAQALRDAIGTVAETTVQYEGGHPKWAGRLRGVLRLDSAGLEFVPRKNPTCCLRLSFAELRAVQPPQTGKHSDEQIESARRQQQAARSMQTLAKMGEESDDEDTRRAAHLSEIEWQALEGMAQLGPPPTNRIVVVAVLDGAAYNLIFLTIESTTKKMEASALEFWSQAAQVSGRFRS